MNITPMLLATPNHSSPSSPINIHSHSSYSNYDNYDSSSSSHSSFKSKAAKFTTLVGAITYSDSEDDHDDNNLNIPNILHSPHSGPSTTSSSSSSLASSPQNRLHPNHEDGIMEQSLLINNHNKINHNHHNNTNPDNEQIIEFEDGLTGAFQELIDDERYYALFCTDDNKNNISAPSTICANSPLPQQTHIIEQLMKGVNYIHFL